MPTSKFNRKHILWTALLVSMCTLTDSAHAQLGTLVPYDASMVTNRWVRGVDVNPNDWPPPPHAQITTRDPAPFGFFQNLINEGWKFVVDNTGGTGTPPPGLVSFEIDFQQPQSITSMRMYSSWTDGPQGAEHRLEHSDDGSNWFTNDGLTFQWETTVGGGLNDAGQPELTGGGYGGWYDWSFNNAQIPYQHWRIASTGDTSKFVNGVGPTTAVLEFYTSGTFTPPELLEWNTTDAGTWIDPTNWDPIGGPPQTREQTARFGTNISGPTTVVTNSAITLNRVEFDNATDSYAVAGLGSVNLLEDTTNSTLPSIDVSAGDHEFQARVTLDADTTINVAAGSSLQFNHQLDLSGNTLTKTGLGTLSFNNVLLTGSGGSLICQEGLCDGNGTINGDVVNSGGTLSPGSANVSGAASASVPEPTSVLLFSIGLALLASGRRKRR